LLDVFFSGFVSLGPDKHHFLKTLTLRQQRPLKQVQHLRAQGEGYDHSNQAGGDAFDDHPAKVFEVIQERLQILVFAGSQFSAVLLVTPLEPFIDRHRFGIPRSSLKRFAPRKKPVRSAETKPEVQGWWKSRWLMALEVDLEKGEYRKNLVGRFRF
jgi:hypothetical protein